MHIAVLCAISALYSLLATSYFLFVEKQENVEVKEKETKKIGKKTRIIYSVFMFVGLCVLSVALPTIYVNNTIIHNMKMITLVAVMFVVALVDYEKQIIPNKIILVALALRCAFYMAELVTLTDGFWALLKNDLKACLIVAVFFIIGVLVMRNSIGMGDIKLMLVMCFYQGFYGVISSLFFSLLVAFFLAIFLLVTRKKSRKDAIPFAPSILIGTAVSVFMTGM